MSDADLSAQLDEAAEREAQRGYEMYQLIPGSEAALALRALVGNDLVDIVRDRIEAGQKSERSSEAA